jgi:hypothetical protein
MLSGMTPKLTLREPTDMAAAVPFLLGFHPADSIVVVGLQGSLAAVVQRWDLVSDAAGLAQAITELVSATAVESVLLVGYGEAMPVRDVMAELRRRLPMPVLGAVRVAGERCYCELCDTCTPEGGTPFDFTSSRVAAEATVAGLAALPSREALVRQVAPVGGLAEIAMTQAVERADVRLAAILNAARDESDPFGVRALHEHGLRAVDAALAGARAGERLDDDQLAWLTLLLHSLPIRDRAWESTDHEPWQLSLWTDLTRRAEPSLVAPAASILAFAAWRDGNGPLAGVALERALGCDPNYSLALLIRDAMLRGIPASHLGQWPDPSAAKRPAGRRRGRSKSTRRSSGQVALRG